jgi:type IV secretory pathway component VirB8
MGGVPSDFTARHVAQEADERPEPVKQNIGQDIPVPDHAYNKKRQGWYESFGASTVERNRYFMICVVLLIALVALAFAFSAMLPLKTVVPYAIRVHDDGTVDAQIMTRSVYEPGEPEKRYFIAKWVESILTVDSSLSEIYLPLAYRMTIGKATDMLKESITTQKPIERAKLEGIKRHVTVNNISFLTPDVAMVIVTTDTTRSGYDDVLHEKYRVSVKFTIIPAIKEEEILTNPIGLRVIDYSINREINQ